MYNKNMENKELKKTLKTFTLLYIEDEDAIRENLLLTLNMIFKNVIAVSNAEEALNIYNNDTPNIILSDINLPNMSGIEFIKIVREENYNIPVILLSAFTDTNILLESTKLKLVDYLTKPVSFDNLYQSFLNATKEIIRDGNIIVKFEDNIIYDIKKKILFKDDKELNLTLNESKLLDLFLNKKDETLPIELIKNHVWEDSYLASDAAFKSLLNKLRLKVGKNTIKNVSGIGYYLVTF